MKTACKILASVLGAVLLAYGHRSAQVRETPKRVRVPEERPGPLPDATYRERWALLVGINKYPNLPPDRQLRYAVKDVEALRYLLMWKYGFREDHIVVLTDSQATLRNIGYHLKAYADGRSMEARDQFLVYFSGHGQTVELQDGDQKGFLLPYDAKVDLANVADRAPYEDTCLSMSTLRDLSDRIPAKHVLFLIDACYSGLALSTSKGLLMPSIPGYLGKVAVEPVRQVITGGMKGETTSEDWKRGHGVFTDCLLQALRTDAADGNHDGVITGDELGTYLQNAVAQATRAKQNPQCGRFGGEGQYLFLEPGQEPPRRWWEWLLGVVPLTGAGLLVMAMVPTISTAVRRVRLWTSARPSQHRESDPGPGPVETQQPEPPSATDGRDGAPMRLIPAGEFAMGRDDGDEDEGPEHIVFLDAFYMDEYQVTNERYARFLNEYGRATDRNGNVLLDLSSKDCLIEDVSERYAPKPGYESHPVVCVSWYGAGAYAEHYGKRLPTEAQWERAARGAPGGGAWPRVNQVTANYGHAADGDVRSSLKPVGQYPPNTCGLYDMMGNVEEWCADWYSEDYYRSSPLPGNPRGPDDGKQRVVRGGAWSSPPGAEVSPYGRGSESPAMCDNSIGFRCVREVRG